MFYLNEIFSTYFYHASDIEFANKPAGRITGVAREREGATRAIVPPLVRAFTLC